MIYDFEQIVIVEQVVGQSTVSTWNLKPEFTNHVEQLDSFNIPKEYYEDHRLTGTAQYKSTNRHGEDVVYTLIRSVQND